MSDDMRVELGCYGSMFDAKTPNLDALAKSGVRFDRNYCQFPLCNPSRASLLTGRNPTKTSVLGNRTDFRNAHPDWTTLPQLFKENGYVTVRAGKIFHGGIDDAKSWSATSDKGGPTDDGSGPAVGHTMEIPRVQIPMPDGVLPPLPADNDALRVFRPHRRARRQRRRPRRLSHRRPHDRKSAQIQGPAVFHRVRICEAAQPADRAAEVFRPV